MARNAEPCADNRIAEHNAEQIMTRNTKPRANNRATDNSWVTDDNRATDYNRATDDNTDNYTCSKYSSSYNFIVN